MKAAVLHEFGTPLAIENVPDPTMGTGEVVVDVVAAPVLQYANEVFSGERRYLLDLPVIPGAGAIGRVRAVGPDSTRLSIGEWVSVDPTVRSRDDAYTPDITLQGLSAGGEGGLALQHYFGNGSYAEQMLVPTENVYPIGAIDPAQAGQWCALNLFLVPYGGLLAIDFQPGETLLVSGATGNFGSAGVAVGLAMGARCVIAPGRNEAMLAELARRFGPRVRTVRLTGDQTIDTRLMTDAAPGPIDCVLDLLPPEAGPEPVQAAAMTVREYGRIVLMGGVGMLGGGDLALPYRWIMRKNITIRGQWMYPRTANKRLIDLVHAGLLDLTDVTVTDFPLDAANDAVTHAANSGAPFMRTIIRP